jgi:hypothetical protein
VFLTAGEVGIAAAVLTAAAGVSGAWLQSRRDDKRWQRERERDESRWQREAAERITERWTDDRRSAHAALLSGTQAWLDIARRNSSAAHPNGSGDLSALDVEEAAVRAALTQVELLASNEVVSLAHKLFQEVLQGGRSNWLLLTAIADTADRDSKAYRRQRLLSFIGSVE